MTPLIFCKSIEALKYNYWKILVPSHGIKIDCINQDLNFDYKLILLSLTAENVAVNV